MSTTYLPDELVAGTTLQVDSIVLSDATPLTHTLAYSFAGSSVDTVSAVALNDNSGWSLTVPPATTQTWPAGDLQAVAYLTRTSDGLVTAPDFGTIRIQGSPSYSSWAATALAAVQAAIQGQASSAQLSFSIGDMQVSNMPIKDLIEMRDYLKAEVKNETAKRPKRIIRARFAVTGR
jgi:hypothetical protein